MGSLHNGLALRFLGNAKDMAYPETEERIELLENKQGHYQSLWPMASPEKPQHT